MLTWPLPPNNFQTLSRTRISTCIATGMATGEQLLTRTSTLDFTDGLSTLRNLFMTTLQCPLRGFRALLVTFLKTLLGTCMSSRTDGFPALLITSIVTQLFVVMLMTR